MRSAEIDAGPWTCLSVFHLDQLKVLALDLVMQTETIDSKHPSVFTIATVFGGCIGMTTASLFGHNGGAGFLLGFGLVFLVLGTAVLIARHRETLANLIVTMAASAPTASSALTTSLDNKMHATLRWRATPQSFLYRFFVEESVIWALESALSKYYRKPPSDNKLQIFNRKIAALQEAYSKSFGDPPSEEELKILARMLRDILAESQKPDSEN